MNGVTPAEVDILDISTWTAAGISLAPAGPRSRYVSKGKGWFKRVDKGQRLGTFILETTTLQTGPVKATIDELKAAIYARPPAKREPHQPPPTATTSRPSRRRRAKRRHKPKLNSWIRLTSRSAAAGSASALSRSPAELAADAAAFAAALPASVEMPAGAGKTHLLSATAKHIVEGGGRVLVLTHTNAGVYAIDARLKRFGISRGVQVSTITSFAFRLARAYPVLGQLHAPKVMVPAHSKAYVEAATRVASSNHIQAVLAASFTHLLVDEYQDCNETHHALVSAVRTAVPATGVLGDPLQAIFGFNDRLADWAAVLAEYPPHSANIRPHRWVGHNEALGDWLQAIRPRMVPGHVVNWTNIALPAGVTFRNIAGNPQGVAQAAFATYPADETVLIIAAWPNTARTIAGDLNGTFTVMEEIAGKFMAESLATLIAADPAAYALWLFDLAKSCHCGHGVLDTGTLRSRYANGRTASDLLAGGSGTQGRRRARDQRPRRRRLEPDVAELGRSDGRHPDVTSAAPALARSMVRHSNVYTRRGSARE